MERLRVREEEERREGEGVVGEEIGREDQRPEMFRCCSERDEGFEREEREDVVEDVVR